MEDELMELMRTKLPQYVVECFSVTGFDTFEVIAQMNTTDGSTSNSIDQIESFILKHFPDNPMYHHTSSLSPSLVFVPGHRIRIIQFVDEIKAKYAIMKGRKRKLASQEASVAMKRPKIDKQLVLPQDIGETSESTGIVIRAGRYY